MGRQINQQDGNIEKIVKLIPSEVVALYLAFYAIIPNDDLPKIIIFALGCVAVVVHLTGGTNVSFDQITQISLTVVSFAVWVIVIGGFDFIDWLADRENGWAKTVIMLFWTWIAPYLVKGVPKPANS